MILGTFGNFPNLNFSLRGKLGENFAWLIKRKMKKKFGVSFVFVKFSTEQCISKSPTTPKDKGVAKRALRIPGPLRQKLLTNRGQSRLFPKTQTAKRHSLTANCYSNLQRTVQQREQAPVVHEIVDQKLLVSSVVVGLQANDVRVP